MWNIHFTLNSQSMYIFVYISWFNGYHENGLCWDTRLDNGILMHKQVYRAGKCLNRTWYSIKFYMFQWIPLFSIKWVLVVNLVRMLMIEAFMLLVHDVQLSQRTPNVGRSRFSFLYFAFCSLYSFQHKSIVTFATVLVDLIFLFFTTLSSLSFFSTW